MATITFGYASNEVAKVKPLTGNPTGLQGPLEMDGHLQQLCTAYTAPSAIAANANIALAYLREAVRIIEGTLFVSGAVATATASVGIVPASTMDDAAINVLGSAIPIAATPGAYPLLGGLTAGTGQPGNMFYDAPADSFVVLRPATAGLNSGAVV
jgi:hypothetical protein